MAWKKEFTIEKCTIEKFTIYDWNTKTLMLDRRRHFFQKGCDKTMLLKLPAVGLNGDAWGKNEFTIYDWKYKYIYDLRIYDLRLKQIYIYDLRIYDLRFTTEVGFCIIFLIMKLNIAIMLHQRSFPLLRRGLGRGAAWGIEALSVSHKATTCGWRGLQCVPRKGAQIANPR